MPKQTVRDIDVTGKKVLVRVDFNVPQTPDGRRCRRPSNPRRLADLDVDPRPARQPDPGQPPGPADRRSRRRRPLPAGQGSRPATGADRPTGAQGARHRRPGGPGRLRPAPARRHRGARERPVQQGREEGRSRLRQSGWRGWPTAMSTTPSAPVTATRPRWWPSPSSSRPSAGRSASWSRKSWRSSTPCSASPTTPTWP